MQNFFQQLINGLSLGSVYALMSVGYSLVYSVMSFSNFAHGGVIMFGAYFGYFFMAFLRFPFIAAFLAALFCAGLLAVAIERVAYRPLRMRSAPFLYFIISAMGMNIFLENIVVATIGPTFRTYPPVFSTEPFHLGPLVFARIDVIILLISAASLALLIFIVDFTKIGKAIQASAFNMKGSALMGINTNFIIMLVFMMSGVLAGAAGVLFGIKYTVYPQLGNITTKSFIAAVFGGLGSIPGAVIGSLLLGLIETFTAAYFSSQFKDLISFVILIIVLVVRPSGLMGKVTEDKA